MEFGGSGRRLPRAGEVERSDLRLLALVGVDVEGDADAGQEERGRRFLARQFAALAVPDDRRIEDDARRAADNEERGPWARAMRRPGMTGWHPYPLAFAGAIAAAAIATAATTPMILRLLMGIPFRLSEPRRRRRRR